MASDEEPRWVSPTVDNRIWMLTAERGWRSLREDSLARLLDPDDPGVLHTVVRAVLAHDLREWQRSYLRRFTTVVDVGTFWSAERHLEWFSCGCYQELAVLGPRARPLWAPPAPAEPVLDALDSAWLRRALLPVLESPEVLERNFAALCLGRWKEAAAIEPIRALADDVLGALQRLPYDARDEKERLTSEAGVLLTALDLCGDPDLVEGIRRWLPHRDLHVRPRLCALLARQGGEEAAAILRALVESEWLHDFDKPALAALGAMLESGPRSLAEPLLDSDSEAVVHRATPLVVPRYTRDDAPRLLELVGSKWDTLAVAARKQLVAVAPELTLEAARAALASAHIPGVLEAYRLEEIAVELEATGDARAIPLLEEILSRPSLSATSRRTGEHVAEKQRARVVQALEALRARPSSASSDAR